MEICVAPRAAAPAAASRRQTIAILRRDGLGMSFDLDPKLAGDTLPVGDLLPPDDSPFASGSGTPPLARIVLNLDNVSSLADGHADILRETLDGQRTMG